MTPVFKSRGKRLLVVITTGLGSLVLACWLFFVVVETASEWDRLPRPTGTFVEPVDLETGHVLADWEVEEQRKKREKPTAGEVNHIIAGLKDEILGKPQASIQDQLAAVARQRQLQEPTARDRLFGTRGTKSDDAAAKWLMEQFDRDHVKRQHLIIDYASTHGSRPVDDPAVRDAALSEITELPLHLVRQHPEKALQIVHLMDFRELFCTTSTDKERDWWRDLPPWPLDPPARPRLSWKFYAALLPALAALGWLSTVLVRTLRHRPAASAPSAP